MRRGIPTKYAGTMFRSRLEARWAAFFDLVEWSWEYEPIDLNGYIPDFIVTPPLDEATLFEVKPLVEWPCAVRGCMCGSGGADARSMLDAAIAKIEASGWTKHALVVGAALRRPGQLGVPEVGVPVAVGAVHWIEIGTVVAKCRRCPVHLLAQDLENTTVVHNCDDSERPALPIDPTPLWREAGNRVQWRPGPRRPAPPSTTDRYVVPAPAEERAAGERFARELAEDADQLATVNSRSVTAESASAYCWRCGYPCGTEAPGEIDPEMETEFGFDFRHVDREQCARNAEANR